MSTEQDAEKAPLSLLDIMHAQTLAGMHAGIEMTSTWHGTRRALLHEALGSAREAYIQSYDNPILKPAEEMVYLTGGVNIMMTDFWFKMSKLYSFQ